MAATTSSPLRLHIGGLHPKEGWKILNIQPGPNVDFIGTATDLSVFADATVDELYGSHIYEHLDYHAEVPLALKEAFRVLKPGGTIMVGVPDLEALCRLFLDPRFDLTQRFSIMRMIYGGQTDPWDYHKSGFNLHLLGQYLYQTGFDDIRRIENFGLFADTTSLAFEGVPISLNVLATKPL